MESVKKFGIHAIFEEIKKYFYVLDHEREASKKQIRRIISNELEEGKDFTREGSNGCYVMTEEQVFHFITTNASIRKYFLRCMEANKEQIEMRLYNDLASVQYGTDEDTDFIEPNNYMSKQSELEIKANAFLHQLLFGRDPDAIYDYFEIDKDKFIAAFLEYEELLDVMDICGLAYLKYKFRYPSIYFHKEKDKE